ncbi:hypothetical protein Tco_0145237 [Tanacetum coccineum]
MVNWIMACVTSTSFSISLNGDVHGEVDSTRVILESLDEFKKISSLVPSIPKSTVFFCNVRNHVKLAILNIMRFNRGKFPVKYLGVPLISSRILNRDCKILVEKATNRIGDWKNKSLSYAGLQLCKSVISSMQVYWASVLIIPKGIILDIQQLIRGFLLCNGELKHGKAKVAWDVICLPKKEGGLAPVLDEDRPDAESCGGVVTSRIFKTVVLRWVPTGKIFTSSTTKVDSEPPHGSNTDITNLHECIQNLDSIAGTSMNVPEKQTLDLNAGTPFNLKIERIKV